MLNHLVIWQKDDIQSELRAAVVPFHIRHPTTTLPERMSHFFSDIVFIWGKICNSATEYFFGNCMPGTSCTLKHGAYTALLNTTRLFWLS